MLPPHNAWVEAFCGSAALTLAKHPMPIEVINDLDGQVVNLFRQLRNNQQALCRAGGSRRTALEEFKTANAICAKQSRWKGRGDFRGNHDDR